ncbi:hypothetical protein HII31_00148 [Pseudocercospora fuligena]|uniref:Extracellular mutant protein 11 C-terminal domain-containing protein n=1 Tax=Pseudocercospora fuligena TaxID=685502 RepID=A0A8H6RWA4_9PEZI|nr:hypothetical protein HII31_00148 [Pseudocercospora fuligena]
MVKDNDQGLHRYVMRQHTAGGYDGQNDNDLSALKVPVPGTGGGGSKKRSTSANTHQTRSNTRPQRKKSAGQKDLAPQGQQDPYGTDASAADQMSTAESAMMMPTRQPKSEQQLMDSQPKMRHARDHDDYEEPEDDNDHEYVNQQATGHQQIASRSGNGRQQPTHDSVTQKRLSGDSYPETTSGAPSTVDQNAMQDRQGQTSQYATSGLRFRGSGGRAIPSGGEHVQVQALTSQIPQHGGMGPPNLYSQPGPRNANALLEGHGSEVPPKAHSPAEHEPQQHPVGGGRGETRSPFEHAQPQLLAKQRANRAETPRQQRPVLPSEAEQEYSDGADPSFNGYPSVNGHDEQYPPEDESLDYEEKELFKMDYGRLKAMPFDADPNIVQFEFDAAEQPDTLEEKFKAAANLPADTQADFLGTLSLEQWEQAGDWFLVRFADLATRFKNARNAKRKAAREFESEIEKRHEMVAKKQKLTEIAMNEMKESGGKVLQGTPKKTRKVK